MFGHVIMQAYVLSRNHASICFTTIRVEVKRSCDVRRRVPPPPFVTVGFALSFDWFIQQSSFSIGHGNDFFFLLNSSNLLLMNKS